VSGRVNDVVLQTGPFSECFGENPTGGRSWFLRLWAQGLLFHAKILVPISFNFRIILSNAQVQNSLWNSSLKCSTVAKIRPEHNSPPLLCFVWTTRIITSGIRAGSRHLEG